MAAIDPSTKPLDTNKPKLATLKIICRPLNSGYGAAVSDRASEEHEDSDDSEAEHADEAFQTEEFVLCTLDPLNVGSGPRCWSVRC
jgi:hypothetical protein